MSKEANWNSYNKKISVPDKTLNNPMNDTSIAKFLKSEIIDFYLAFKYNGDILVITIFMAIYTFVNN